MAENDLCDYINKLYQEVNPEISSESNALTLKAVEKMYSNMMGNIAASKEFEKKKAISKTDIKEYLIKEEYDFIHFDE